MNTDRKTSVFICASVVTKMAPPAATLLAIALLWFATAVAPGPNFLVTTRTALLNDRAAGVGTACGIACGTIIWGFAGFFGIHALFILAPWLYRGLKIGGSAYLMILGTRYLLRSLRQEITATERAPPMSTRSAMLLGMVTSLANPQTALSTASLFAATLPPQPSLALGIAAVALMTMVAIVWYSFVACVLTIHAAAIAFAHIRRWVDGIAGLAFVAFGTKLALER